MSLRLGGFILFYFIFFILFYFIHFILFYSYRRRPVRHVEFKSLCRSLLILVLVTHLKQGEFQLEGSMTRSMTI